MTTIEEAAVSPEIFADGQALIESLVSGAPLDLEVARRIRERGDRITDQIYREQGLVDIAVPTLREIRQ